MPTIAGYEFSADENDTFKGLVQNLARSGIVVVVASVILVAYHVVGHLGISLGATPSEATYYLDLAIWFAISVIGAVVGVLLVRATTAFSAVIHTQGNDIEHLMRGLARLRDVLGLVFWATTAGSLLLAVSFLLLLTFS